MFQVTWRGWGSFKVLTSSKIQNCPIKLKIGMDTNLGMEILKMNVSRYREMVGQGCRRSGMNESCILIGGQENIILDILFFTFP